MVKDMACWTTSELAKPHYLMRSRKPLLGEGILSANGDLWAYEKKILAPKFFMEKVKIEKSSLFYDSKYLLIKSNREIRMLNQEVRLLILDLCKEHRSRSHGNNVTHMSTHDNLFHAIINGADPAIAVPQKISSLTIVTATWSRR
ncbi:hypothetical protein C2845_PM09G14140 [Panicum miliaceum]|uniref:Uncharacterized protein n=1 Tax=Panicum miliaceum TaxID=4540 RepID=A0A3L6RWD0_PANMI|nr:hypothetical protein C2845_PM09G14140 [Panicum miliaceum]